MNYYIPTTEEIRGRIKDVEDLTLRYALMCQYLVGGLPSEVYGKYGMQKKDIKKIFLDINGESIPAIVFFTRRIKKHPPTMSVLPFEKKYEPWVELIYNWISKYEKEEDYLFQFGKYKVLDLEDNKTTGMTRARKIFKGFHWWKTSYKNPKTGERQDRRPANFTSSMLKNSRKRSLMDDYFFDDVELAYYGDWEDPINVENEIKIENIMQNKPLRLDVNGVKNQCHSYFDKFLRPYGEIGTEIKDYIINVNSHEDLKKRIENTQEIIELLKYTNMLFEGKIGYKFSIDDTSELLSNLLSACKNNNNDFRSRIISLAYLFEVKYDKNGNKIKTYERGRTSLQIIEAWINNKPINTNSDMLLTWNNIRSLRNCEVHSTVDSREYLDLLVYFGLSRKIPPRYDVLWDKIVIKYIESLKEWNQILNDIP